MFQNTQEMRRLLQSDPRLSVGIFRLVVCGPISELAPGSVLPRAAARALFGRPVLRL